MGAIREPDEGSYYAFLSSLCREHWDIRRDIYQRWRKTERPIYVDEQIYERRSDENPLGIVDHLIKQIRLCPLFICLVGGPRHGERITVRGSPSSVSFFEIEIFQAALLSKPIHLIVQKGFAPEPRLEELLGILEFALPEWRSQQRLADHEIPDEVARVIEKSPGAKQSSRILWAPRAREQLVQRLFARQNGGTAGLLSGMRFLASPTEERHQYPRVSLIEDVLQALSHERDEERRLGRLWIAIRELMNAPPFEPASAEFLPLWERVLTQWSRASAWYGLHGHLYLGRLAALNTLSSVRRALVRQRATNSLSGEFNPPYGAIASALYSIGKRLPPSRTRETMLSRGFHCVEREIRRNDGDRSGLLAIRGAILLESGNRQDAVRDYKVVVRFRERAASPGGLGEALADLGLAHVLYGRGILGRDYAMNGVRLLEHGARVGFLVRAKKRLARAYLATGQLSKADRQQEEAREIAMRYGVFDQLEYFP